MHDTEAYKRQAAHAALEEVAPGMRLGLGTGSTAAHFVRALGERVRAGLAVRAVPTSEATAALARAEGVELAALNDIPELDLTVDGADEIGPGLVLIKGGGGALLREKIVAGASARMVVVADASKVVDFLGSFPLPIEVVPFGQAATLIAVERQASRLGLSGEIRLRRHGDAVFVTDEGNHILDASFGRIPDPEALALCLSGIPGVVEHGLFVGMATSAIVGGQGGVTRITT